MIFGVGGCQPPGCADHDQERESDVPMTPTSRAFQQGGTIPMKYTCDGDNISPPFAWSGVPEGTRSLRYSLR